MCLRVSVGSRMLGKLVGTTPTVDRFLRVLSGWRENWNSQEVKQSEVLLLPVPTIDGPDPRDWVLAVVRGVNGGEQIGEAQQLQLTIYDRTVRRQLSERIAKFLKALLYEEPGASDLLIVQKDLPECKVATQRSGCVLGVIASLVQEQADQVCLDRASPTFVPDVFAVLRAVFGKLRTEAAARGLKNLNEYLRGEELRNILPMFGRVPRLQSVSVGLPIFVSSRHERPTTDACMKAVTWNISGGTRSAQAPESWLLADQGNEIIREVLRWEADVVCLQEVESATPLERLVDRCQHVGSSRTHDGFQHVGSSRSHCGFVHLYVSKALEFADPQSHVKGVVACTLRLKAGGSEAGQEIKVVAVHLPSGPDEDKVRSRSKIVANLVGESDASGMLILGDMNCHDDEAIQLCRDHDLSEACYTGFSWGARGNKYHAGPQRDGFGFRYDRIFMSGSVCAESFVVGNRRTFFEGCEFFLSDHFPVVGFFESHSVFQYSDSASVSMARTRRGRLAEWRDRRFREEQLESFELWKRGREEKLLVRDAAVEEERIAAFKDQRKALIEQGRRADERREVAVGVQSLWRGELREEASSGFAEVRLHGWEEDGWEREVPSDVFLRGITSGQTDVVMPCFLQVILRLPQMYAWLEMHAQHCERDSGCLLCWLSFVQKGLNRRVNRPNLQVGFLPEGVRPEDLQDMKVVFEEFLGAASKSEIAYGRCAEMPVPACRSVVVTHVDRTFGWFRETRTRCCACGECTQRTAYSKSRVFTLPVKTSDRGRCTVSDLYLESCVSAIDMLRCSKCEVCTKHDVASRLSTTPDVLLLWLDRGSGHDTTRVDVEEDLSLPGLASLRLVAVIYQARRADGVACYSCACRGPMDAWWYFEEGRAPEYIRGFVSHVKQTSCCMLIYERVTKRGKGLKRKKDAVSSRGSDRSKKRARIEHPVPAEPRNDDGSGLTAWPLRALKRYPSCANEFDFESIFKDRYVEEAVRFVRRRYPDLLGSASGDRGCLSSPEAFDSGSVSLAKATYDQLETVGLPLRSVLKSSDMQLSVFSYSCIVHAFDWLKGESGDSRLRSLCEHASRWCLDQGLFRALQCEDVSSCVAMMVRVTGVVDLDDAVSSKDMFARCSAASGSNTVSNSDIRAGVVQEVTGTETTSVEIVDLGTSSSSAVTDSVHSGVEQEVAVIETTSLESPQLAISSSSSAVTDPVPKRRTLPKHGRRVAMVSVPVRQPGSASIGNARTPAPNAEETSLPCFPQMSAQEPANARSLKAGAAERRREEARARGIGDLRGGRKIATTQLARDAVAAMQRRRSAQVSRDLVLSHLREQYGAHRVNAFLDEVGQENVDLSVLEEVLAADEAHVLEGEIDRALERNAGQSSGLTRWQSVLRNMSDVLREGLLVVLFAEYKSQCTAILSSEWSLNWVGWDNRRRDALPDPHDGDGLHQVLEYYRQQEEGELAGPAMLAVHDVVRRHIRLAHSHSAVTHLTDQQKVEVLLREGLKVGQGNDWGANNCLPDSLLQLMQENKIIASCPELERKEACAALRAALIKLPEKSVLRPRRRDAVNSSHLGVDDGAFLQSNVHGEYILKFFLKYFSARGMVLRQMPSAGVRISIVSRFDSDFILGEHTDVCQQRIVNVDDQRFDFKLFNRTGEGVSGYHYDPITVLPDSNVASSSNVASVAGTETTSVETPDISTSSSSAVTDLVPNCRRKRLRDAEVVPGRRSTRIAQQRSDIISDLDVSSGAEPEVTGTERTSLEMPDLAMNSSSAVTVPVIERRRSARIANRRAITSISGSRRS